MLTCSICSDLYAPVGRDPLGVCDECGRLNLAGASPPLWTPPPPPPSLPTPVCEVLDAATAAALDAYAAHVQRTEAAALRRLWRAHEEDR